MVKITAMTVRFIVGDDDKQKKWLHHHHHRHTFLLLSFSLYRMVEYIDADAAAAG